MNTQRKIASVTLWVNRLIIAAVAVLIFTLQPIIRWYCTLRTLTGPEQTAISLAFYCCAAVIFFALWNMDRLLTAILQGQVFVRNNVKRIRRIQLSCGLVSLICIPPALPICL